VDAAVYDILGGVHGANDDKTLNSRTVRKTLSSCVHSGVPTC